MGLRLPATGLDDYDCSVGADESENSRNSPLTTNAVTSPMSTATVPVIGRAARMFHALSDETRLEIVRLLSHGERCVCELQQVLDAAQSRPSFHLRTLKDAGLVSDRREGRWVYYALNRDALDQIAEFASEVKPGKHAGSCARACCP